MNNNKSWAKLGWDSFLIAIRDSWFIFRVESAAAKCALDIKRRRKWMYERGKRNETSSLRLSYCLQSAVHTEHSAIRPSAAFNSINLIGWAVASNRIRAHPSAAAAAAAAAVRVRIVVLNSKRRKVKSPFGVAALLWRNKKKHYRK